MNKFFAASALALVTGSSLAGGFSEGNIDLYGWAVDHPAPTTGMAVPNEAGSLSQGNIDLYGWVVDDRTVGPQGSTVGDVRGNIDLYGWVVDGV